MNLKLQCNAERWELRISKGRGCAVKGKSVVNLKLEGNVVG